MFFVNPLYLLLAVIPIKNIEITSAKENLTEHSVETEPYQATGSKLTEIIAHTPGVHLRSGGSFNSIALRGLSGNNVLILLDEQPLSSALLGPFDFNLLSTEAVERIEIYRGQGPIRFQNPIGGVLRLVSHLPKDKPEYSAHLGYGSFLTRSAHVFASGPWLFLRYAAFLSYQGSEGNFPYYDDRATLYNTTDDRKQTRKNNDFDSGFLRLVLETDVMSQGLLRLSSAVALRDQEIAGQGNQQFSQAHASLQNVMNRLELQHLHLLNEHLLFSLGVDSLLTKRSFRDPLLETGLTTNASDATLVQVGFDLRHEIFWHDQHKTEISPRLEYSRYEQTGAEESASLKTQALLKNRLQFGNGIEHQWQILPRLLIAPTLRLDTVFNENLPLQLSPRLKVNYRFNYCELQASGGRFHRFPTLIERFGDGMVTIPNPDLKPEYGLSADLSSQCAVGKSETEMAVYATKAYDLIALSQTAQNYFSAENLDTNTIMGVEFFEHYAFLTWVKASLSYAFTQAQNNLSKQTQGIPKHRFDFIFTLGPKELNLRYEMIFLTQSYLDQANLQPIAPRIFHNIFAVFVIPGTDFSVQGVVQNLSNVQKENVSLSHGVDTVRSVTDFLNYPLPGRSFFISVLWRRL